MRASNKTKQQATYSTDAHLTQLQQENNAVRSTASISAPGVGTVLINKQGTVHLSFASTFSDPPTYQL